MKLKLMKSEAQKYLLGNRIIRNQINQQIEIIRQEELNRKQIENTRENTIEI